MSLKARVMPCLAESKSFSEKPSDFFIKERPALFTAPAFLFLYSSITALWV